MENMDKGLTVPKWVLINWPKIPQMPQNLSAQIVCPSPKVWDFDEKRLHWASVVCDTNQGVKPNLNFPKNVANMQNLANNVLVFSDYIQKTQHN